MSLYIEFEEFLKSKKIISINLNEFCYLLHGQFTYRVEMSIWVSFR